MDRTPTVVEDMATQRDDGPGSERARFARRFAVTLLATLSATAIGSPSVHAEPEAESLRVQLGDLAYAEGITIRGLARLGDAAPRDAHGTTLFARLKSLLFGYNYLLIHDPSGAINEVRIVGVERSHPIPQQRFYVPAVRRGPHHAVDAVLTGPSGAWQAHRLLLDTGASTIVLPASAIERLGFEEEDLAEAVAATAGGEVPARTGRLASVTVGSAVASDVAVTFIEDARLSGPPLLGMSFLDQFSLAIDDAAGQIILTAK